MEEFQPVNLFLKGGIFMWPILLCSVIGLAVILDRAIFFLTLRGSGVMSDVWLLLEERRVQEAMEMLAKQRHPVAAVTRTYLQNFGRTSSLRVELVKAEGALQLARVEKHLRILATISHLSPLLGLLGTVTGLVITFAQMQALGATARPSDLAGGIWEALLTTVFGLIVAIPCMAAFHGFEGLADTIARRMQASVVVLDDILDAVSDFSLSEKTQEHLEGESLDVIG